MLTSFPRSLRQALIVSLLLHAVLLSSTVNLFPARLDVQGGAINALIRPVPGDPPAPSAPVAKSLAGSAKGSSPPSRAAAERQIVVAQPAATEAASVPVNSAPRESPAPVAPGPASRLGAGAVAPVLSGTAPVSSYEGVAADDLRQYRVSLATAARRFKRYPALASQRGWEGTVEVALNVNARTSAPEVVLVRSSGRGVLDEQAIEMMAQAARVTALPEGLKARDFRILLPVQFSLDNDQ